VEAPPSLEGHEPIRELGVVCRQFSRAYVMTTNVAAIWRAHSPERGTPPVPAPASTAD
jgi:hypothetical protein